MRSAPGLPFLLRQHLQELEEQVRHALAHSQSRPDSHSLKPCATVSLNVAGLYTNSLHEPCNFCDGFALQVLEKVAWDKVQPGKPHPKLQHHLNLDPISIRRAATAAQPCRCALADQLAEASIPKKEGDPSPNGLLVGVPCRSMCCLCISGGAG